MRWMVIWTVILALVTGCSRNKGDILEIHIGHYEKDADGLYNKLIFDPNPILTSINVQSAKFIGPAAPSPWAGEPDVGPAAKLEEDAPDEENIFSIRLTDDGRRILAEATAANLKKWGVIISEGRKLASLYISTHVTNGIVVVTGNFTEAQGRRIVRELNQKPEKQ